MKLVALYKTFDGGEWIDASLSSIYNDVDAIVMVHAAHSWLGQEGNDVYEAAKAWCAAHDECGKIHHVCVDVRTQEEQYAAGLEYIAANRLPWDLIMAIDADEVWQPGHLYSAKGQIKSDRNPAPAYQAQMHTYLRTPFYRVDPPYGRPVTFFRDPTWLTKCPRGCKAQAKELANVWFHHFSYVRQTDADVARKIQQSCFADHNETIVPDYFDTTWRDLPHGKNLHAFTRWRHVWQSVERVYWSDIPSHVRQCQLMQSFWPEGLLMDGERDVIRNLSVGKRLAVDLGTFKGLSAVVESLGADQVHTFDLFDGVLDKNITANVEEQYETLWNTHQHTLGTVGAILGRYGNITIHHGDTVAGAQAFADRSVDFIFIDADHSYEGTKANWQAWWPKLQKQCVLLFHDNNEIHPGVMEAVAELERESRLVTRIPLGEYAGSLAAFRKI